ncbi:DUF3237 family protein [Bacillus alkalicellulosilyticus]|uniref:DUF3237 family protein n=1 Tax=Alkalihalobacterium alkalicellulosilyticum TaxID=1912214 RepID=UPI0009975619|nr:DUF3237 family protein [Bacillus alkalicellulosilyticus]
MQLEEVFTVHVKIEKTIELSNNDGDSVVMISFSGNVKGKYFEGTVLEGGIDTQIIGKCEGQHTLSARYMLQGRDSNGQDCEIYIENNGTFNKNLKGALFRTYPKIITNSKQLSFLNNDILVGEGIPSDTGVDIKIFRAI